MDVKAELTANVWKLLVAVGDTVAAGQELAILESMKMEIPVESPIAGTVAALLVAEGGQIDENSVILVVEPTSS